MPDIGKLNAKITADPSGFVAGTNAAITQTNYFTGMLMRQFSGLGSGITRVLSAVGGTAIGGAIGGITSAIGSGMSLLAAGISGPQAAVTAIAAGAAAFAVMGQAGISMVGTQARLARQLGVTTREAFGLSGAMEGAGISVENQGSIIQAYLRRTGQLQQHMQGTTAGMGAHAGGNISNAILTGSNAGEHDQMATGLRQLGIDAQQFVRLGITDQLRQLTIAMEGVTNVNQRAALGFQILGRHGAQLMPLISRGREEFERMNALGEIRLALIGDRDIERMQGANKAMRESGHLIGAIFDSLKLFAGATIAPLVNEFNTFVSQCLRPIQPILGLLANLMVIWLAPALVLAPSIISLFSIFVPLLTGISRIITALGDAWNTVTTELRPIGTLISDIWQRMGLGATAGGLVAGVFDMIVRSIRFAGQAAGMFIEGLRNSFVGNLFSGIANAIPGIWERLKSGAIAAWNFIRDLAAPVWGFFVASAGRAIGVITAIYYGLQPAFDAVKSAGLAVWNAVGSTFMAVWSSIKSIASAVWVTITMLWKAVVTVFDAIARALGFASLEGINWLALLEGAVVALTAPIRVAASFIESVAFGIRMMADAITAAADQVGEFTSQAQAAFDRIPAGGLLGRLLGGNTQATELMNRVSNWQTSVVSITDHLTGKGNQPVRQGDVGASALVRGSADAVAAEIQHQFADGGRLTVEEQQLAQLENIWERLDDVIEAIEENPTITYTTASFGGN